MAITKDKAMRAANEAKRFLAAVNALSSREGADNYINGCKESGAVRRVSLDLTRALAELRKS